MVKIFSLLALAVVVSACGNALSAPVSEESTKETPSDLDAHAPSISKNIRGAEEGDALDSHDSEERVNSFTKLGDDAADMAMPFLAKAVPNEQTAGTSGWWRSKFMTYESPEVKAFNNAVNLAMEILLGFKKNTDLFTKFKTLYRAKISPHVYLEAQKKIIERGLDHGTIDEAVLNSQHYTQYWDQVEGLVKQVQKVRKMNKLTR